MKRIKIHPLFLILILVQIVMGKWKILVSTILAVTIHEYSHHLVARLKGYSMIELTFMPYGAVISSKECFLPDDEVLIAAAGPFSNILLSIFTIALWWVFPSSYSYTLDFFRANIIIASFNMLPAYPLDGARIILSIAKDKQRTVKILKIIGIILSICFMCGFILSSIFYRINYTLGVASVFLFASSLVVAKEQTYIHLCNQLPYLKNYNLPLEKKIVVVKEDIIIKKIIRILQPYTLTEIEVVDSAMRRISRINENQLEEICLSMPADISIGQAIKLLKS